MNPPQDVEVAYRFANNPQLELYDAQQRLISSELIVATLDTGLFAGGLGILLNGNHQVPVTITISTSPVKRGVVRESQIGQDPQTVAALSFHQKSATISMDQQLVQLWQQATRQERQNL